MIVDTNALSAFADRDQNVREYLLSGSGPYLPSIVVGEYRFGLFSSREREKRLVWLEALIREWEVLEVSEKTAAHYAELRHQLKIAATPIPSNDVWIAALAREHRLPILTNDPQFDLVKGVERMAF